MHRTHLTLLSARLPELATRVDDLESNMKRVSQCLLDTSPPIFEHGAEFQTSVQSEMQ